MIWRWLTCFNSCALLLAGPVTGTVEIAGVRDLTGVVVWLEPARPMKVQPAAHQQMVQKNKTFSPHVLAIPVGTAVAFPNYDPIFHNAFSNFNGTPFDVGLYPPGTSRTVVFRRAGIVRVFCNIHASMSAVIAVLPTPYFALSNNQGAVRISDVPAGEYTLRVFYELTPEKELEALTRKIIVGAGGATLPRIALTENRAPAPHKDKYGKDYPHAGPDGSTYPGATK